MAKASDESYRETIGRVENKAGLQDFDEKAQRIKEAKDKPGVPPTDPRAQKALRRAGLL